MKFVILAIVLVFASANIHPVNQVLVDEIKAKATTWTPMEPEENPFAYKSIEEIKGMMGLKLGPKFESSSHAEGLSVPDEFDAREQWKEHIHQIRDQAQCGSCWAFAASEALSDRFAIATKGEVRDEFSPEYLVACDKENFGCGGGYLDKAWNFLVSTGVPTDKCVSYKSGSGSVGPCPGACDDGSEIKLYKAKSVETATTPALMKEAIFTGGPVEVGFMVYQDFMSYKTGVYKHTSGGLLGGHAVKAIGWGVDKQAGEYWIMANSWTESWGEKGFFKIGFGECQVEDYTVYGDALITTLESE